MLLNCVCDVDFYLQQRADGDDDNNDDDNVMGRS